MAATQIPAKTVYSVRKRLIGKDNRLVVAAVQRSLNAFGWRLTVDGLFGKRTKRAVSDFQRSRSLIVDGEFGPQCSERTARELEEHVVVVVPPGLLHGFITGESGDTIGAVNWSVPGGVDCSYVQRRVYQAEYGNTEVEGAAFNPLTQLNLAARQLRDRYEQFRSWGNSIERSWRLAALAHNWPWAADQLARGNALPNKPCTWAGGAKFADGASVETYSDWAAFYAGLPNSHGHSGLVTRFVTDWTS